jgi:hypothetical protein
MRRCNIKLSLQLVLEPEAFSVTSVRDDLNLGAKSQIQINEIHKQNKLYVNIQYIQKKSLT